MPPNSMPTSRAHPEDAGVARALEELGFFTTRLTILGVYPAHPFREDMPDCLKKTVGKIANYVRLLR